MDNIAKNLRLEIKVGLDTNNMPVHIEWLADGAPEEGGAKSSKGMLLSFFDRDTLDTYKIDLWVNDMQVVEMDRFMFQTLRALADTYFKATNNQGLATDMQRFVQYFGEQVEILPKTNG